MVNRGQNCPYYTSREESLFRRSVIERYAQKPRVVLVVQLFAHTEKEKNLCTRYCKLQATRLFSPTLTLLLELTQFDLLPPARVLGLNKNAQYIRKPFRRASY